jgi:surface antigen
MKIANWSWLVACAAIAAAPLAGAAGWGALLNDRALTDFNDDDLRDYLTVVNRLLEAPLPATPVEWSNPRTGAGARLEVIGQPQIEGFKECRRVRTEVYTRKQKAQARTWTACRDDDGGWRLVRGN